MGPSVSNRVTRPEGGGAEVGEESGNFSIVICSKDRPADLARAIASIRTSGEAGRNAEIVVVEESDCPREIADVRYVHLPRAGRGFGYARNVGLRAAGGKLILFIDDDCEAERGWVEALTAPFHEDRQILGVAGAVLVRRCGLIGYAENILGFPGGGLRYLHQAHGQVVPTRYLSTCNCAYRRDVILRRGGFREDARMGGEDALLAERVTSSGACVYAPGAVVYHRTRDQLSAIFRWFVRRGHSEMAMLRATAERRKFVDYLLRSSWTLRLLSVLLLLVLWPRLTRLVPGTIAAYYGAILWRFRFARSYPTHRAAWWLVPVVKLVMDLGAEVGRWRALILRER